MYLLNINYFVFSSISYIILDKILYYMKILFEITPNICEGKGLKMYICLISSQKFFYASDSFRLYFDILFFDIVFICLHL